MRNAVRITKKGVAHHRQVAKRQISGPVADSPAVRSRPRQINRLHAPVYWFLRVFSEPVIRFKSQYANLLGSQVKRISTLPAGSNQ